MSSPPVTLRGMVSVAERLRTNSDTLLIVFDLIGTLVFALEGALRAIRGDLDFLGLLVLAFVTAVGGGIIRDLLIGVEGCKQVVCQAQCCPDLTCGEAKFFVRIVVLHPRVPWVV